MKNIIGIMAATKNGIIGHNNKLPWNYPDELEHFQQTTLHQIVVMGKKTYESTPKSFFKDRKAMVLSRNTSLSLKDANVFKSVHDFLNYLNNDQENSNCFMIGGGEIADLFLKNGWISSFFFTEIHKPYTGDTYMNLDLLRDWSRKEIKKTENYTIYFLKNPQEKR